MDKMDCMTLTAVMAKISLEVLLTVLPLMTLVVVLDVMANGAVMAQND